MRRQVEQVFFFLAGRWQLGEILRIDNYMTGRARHDPLASAFKRLAGGPRDIEQPLPGGCFHFLVESPVGFEKTHKSHASSFSCATACAAMRLQASVSSCWVV